MFFSTDVHGNEKCWRKFVNAGEYYDADVLILGGDLTGKMIQPIIQQPSGGWKYYRGGKELFLGDEDELSRHEKELEFSGIYPYRTTFEEAEKLAANEEARKQVFLQAQIETLARWFQFAQEKLGNRTIYLAPGNDDDFVIDSVLERYEVAMNCEGKVVWVDDQHEMISSGWTNPTPWKTFREQSEESLAERIESMASKVEDVSSSIFALHAPPYNTGLDEAPRLDTRTETFKMVGADETGAVGSKAVRSLIEKYQPLLGLHGHVHEGKGNARIGRTICFNPGSVYTEGILNAAVIDLDKKRINRWFFISG